ncbi:beta-defensin 110 isoform X2 [Macaca thibetana thibetana]|uniref:Beta-defensin n=4 Tax=Cercopithecinae TaxID=9528 RepID=A0A2K5MZN4_CERAT|nr:beta-defensin 110 isoform X2 [Macaca fascicularis]XP_050643404.1 beta-defensin 110 isoform X2 [Macaca thibetana thibetana]
MKIQLFFFILLFWVTVSQARNYFEPKYRFERCEKVRGICKTFCDDVEYDYGYCIKWRSQCCV